jgi:hypothetical protein
MDVVLDANNNLDITIDLSNYYLKDVLYTKTETDNLFNNYYNKTEIDTTFGNYYL